MKKNKKIREKEEINRMIGEGLGAGRIVEEVDKEKLAPPSSANEKENRKNVMNGEMAATLKEMKKLGKEMEQMDTNEELEEKGQQSDPSQ